MRKKWRSWFKFRLVQLRWIKYMMIRRANKSYLEEKDWQMMDWTHIKILCQIHHYVTKMFLKNIYQSWKWRQIFRRHRHQNLLKQINSATNYFIIRIRQLMFWNSVSPRRTTTIWILSKIKIKLLTVTHKWVPEVPLTPLII